VSAKFLAKPESEVAGIVACGVQGRTNLEALAVLFPLKKVYAYDINAVVQERYVAEMSRKLDIEVVGVSEPRTAVEDCDLVVTSGPILKDPQPTIDAGWLKPGGFASAVDFDSYWTGSALREMDKISTDDLAQFEYYKQVGYFKETPQPYADLGEIVTGNKPGRESETSRTMAINLGLAMDDMAVAPEIFRLAVEKDLGTRLPL
jgi:ornithine cyclodeaminase/alanine dehydrogenase